ncbi:hypothetical protein DACRYDRAFT_63875 [Dacryopinax primogenitus]|uniref:Expansin-like EG45 domain-containing protein n=1 Tax=Dacryopinax primogenitus (strain DJM 731) TaxID=1858805 RepID=M5G6A0_DACPD|nr:uncharacterized protein DACRYDRAFT_63875 [Dacryopinax primogenitus]EJU04214.1 hypothetical protein DACRYDRAFT_63875 [Dacryopinax primogenitus]
MILTFLYPLLATVVLAQEWQMQSSGLASLTHYNLPTGYVGSCGCEGESSGNYPTAALNQLAFGSAYVYGPGCGRCFNLTLLDSWTSTPPFFPSSHPSVIVKITDLCPGSSPHCQATASKPNEFGYYVHFDLAYPTPAIPTGFFPSNASYYGYTDFGVWNITYTSVECIPNWAGSGNAGAMGRVPALGSSACCPGEPGGNDTCPSYSSSHVLPPNTAGGAPPRLALPYLLAMVSVCLVLLGFS